MLLECKELNYYAPFDDNVFVIRAKNLTRKESFDLFPKDSFFVLRPPPSVIRRRRPIGRQSNLFNDSIRGDLTELTKSSHMSQDINVRRKEHYPFCQVAIMNIARIIMLIKSRTCDPFIIIIELLSSFLNLVGKRLLSQVLI